MAYVIDKSVLVKAPAKAVWKHITDLSLMTKWSGEPDMQLEIVTSWEVGSPFIIRGFHHLRFENKGTVLVYSPERLLSYNFLSSLSRLPETDENRSVVRFTLTPLGEDTLLSLNITNFPTATIYQHLNFYWNTTIVILKNAVENAAIA
jgi:uncharacterized protein YndB with AHSA1/START domain